MTSPLTTLSPIDALPRSPMLSSIEPLIAAFSAGAAEMIARWPYPPGPAGPIRTPDGTGAHGAFALDMGAEVMLCVANNGWPIEARRCPGPNPGALEMLNPCNAWLAQQPTLVGELATDVRTIDATFAAIQRVVVGDKPLALADTVDEEEAERWVGVADELGLAHDLVRDDLSVPGCATGPGWFFAIARTERFEDLVDLPAVADYYDRALDPSSPYRARVATSLARLASRCPADFLDQVEALVMAPFADDHCVGCPTEVTGIVLGYWPPTTANLILGMSDDGSYRERGPAVDLRPWNHVRFETAAAVQRGGDLFCDL